MEGNFVTEIMLYVFLFVIYILAVPSNVNYSGVLDDLLHLPGVRNAHSLHIWSLSLQRTALSVHIAIGK
jgi:Co/Zn/Cd efflux system component